MNLHKQVVIQLCLGLIPFWSFPGTFTFAQSNQNEPAPQRFLAVMLLTSVILTVDKIH
jgi:hypothetical protein